MTIIKLLTSFPAKKNSELYHKNLNLDTSAFQGYLRFYIRLGFKLFLSWSSGPPPPPHILFSKALSIIYLFYIYIYAEKVLDVTS